jgi:hypothetical protein
LQGRVPGRRAMHIEWEHPPHTSESLAGGCGTLDTSNMSDWHVLAVANLCVEPNDQHLPKLDACKNRNNCGLRGALGAVPSTPNAS